MKLDLLKPETFNENKKPTELTQRSLLDSLAGFFHVSSLNLHNEMVEHEDSFTLNIELPGLNKNDIHVEAYENRIIVKAAKQSRHQYSVESDMYLRQMTGGVYQRIFDLPCSVDKDQIYANYNRGTLEIFLPKLTEARHIEIQQQDMVSDETFFDSEWSEKSSNIF